MTTLQDKIIHEANMAIFEVLGEQFQCSFTTAEGVVVGLLATKKTSSLLFSNIVLSRSFLLTTPIPTYQRQCMSTWTHKGPVDVTTFIKLIQFNRTLVFEPWKRHLQNLTSIKT
jgi:hypothetical protein